MQQDIEKAKTFELHFLPNTLTKSERNIAEHLLKSMNLREIGNANSIDVKTVRFHVRSIYKKCDLHRNKCDQKRVFFILKYLPTFLNAGRI